nr:hypothetical protein [Caldalkalibacillus salinus]
MKNKKTLTIVGATIVGTTVIISSLSLSSVFLFADGPTHGLPTFKNEFKVVETGTDENVLVERISQEEAHDYGEDGLPNIGSESVLSYESNELTNLDHEKVDIQYEYGELKLIKIHLEDKTVISSQKGKSNPALQVSENRKFYTFEENQDIFVYDSVNDQVRKVTKDTVGGFSKDQIMSREDKGYHVWAKNPKVSEISHAVAYVTKRENEERFDIWTVDLESGKEELAVENALPLTWYDGSLFYKKWNEKENVGKYNMETKEKTTIIPETAFVETKGDYLIYPVDLKWNHFRLYNLKTNEVIKVESETGRLGGQFHVSPNQEYAATIYQEDGTKPPKHFLIVNLETGNQQIIDFPNLPADHHGHFIEGWVNNREIVISYTYGDRNNEREEPIKSETIMIDVIAEAFDDSHIPLVTGSSTISSQ